MSYETGGEQMSKIEKDNQEKLDILNQTRDRTPMPRPAVFRNKKKYDRNAVKDEDRKERGFRDDTKEES